MNSLGDFHFIRPAWLLLAPVVTWVWWRVRTAQDPLRGWRKVMDPELLDVLTVGRIADPSGDNANRLDGMALRPTAPGVAGACLSPGCWLSSPWQDQHGVPNPRPSPTIPYP